MTTKPKILYVYGWKGSASGSTITMLRTKLPQYEWICETYPQTDPYAALDYLTRLAERTKPDLILGSSLGGFLTLKIPGDYRKIVFNPCMLPGNELAALEASEEAVKGCRELQEDIWNHKPSDRIKGYFSYQDELLGDKYQSRFREHYGDIELVDSPHRMSEKALNSVASGIESFLDN